MDHECYECGAPLAMKRYVHRQHVGRFHVEDSSCVLPVCENGHAEIDGAMLRRYEQRAIVTVLADAEKVGGAEVSFTRRSLGLTQERLSKLLGVVVGTLSKWENGHDAISQAARVALCALTADPALIDRLEHADAKPGDLLAVNAA